MENGDKKIVLLHALNFFDALLTLYAVRLGVLELNPLMAWAIDAGPVVFLVTKVLVVSVGIEFLNRHLKEDARRLLSYLFYIYCAVILWHLFGVLALYSISPSENVRHLGAYLGKGYAD
tara:strand:+ start:48203 stop:48559 length:357 start_codon:yes stop_codon:yes gene_type:complete